MTPVCLWRRRQRAARLESLAEPEGICVSRKVYEDMSGKMQLAFVDLGEQQLQNIQQPVRIYRVSGEQLAVPQATAKPALALPDRPSIAVLERERRSRARVLW